MAALTLADAARPDALTGPSPASLAWSPDSRWLAYTLAGELLLAPPDPTPTPTAVCAGVAEFVWLRTGSLLVLTRDGAVCHCATPSADGTAPEPRPLLTLEAGASELGVSPDESTLSFIVAGDLWLCRLKAASDGSLTAATPRQVTDVGVPPIASVQLGTYYGVDRGLGRCVWGSAAPAYEWSADGAWICAHYVDRSAVRKVPFPYYLSEETSDNWHRRPYPGDDDEIRRLALIDASGWDGDGLLPMELVELSAPGVPAGHGCGFNTFSWRPLGAELLVDVTSDTGQARGLHLLAPAASGSESALVWSDFGEDRTYPSVSAGWLQDGSAAWLIIDAEQVHQLALIDMPTVPELLSAESPPPVRMLTVRYISCQCSARRHKPFRRQRSSSCMSSLTGLFVTG